MIRPLLSILEDCTARESTVFLFKGGGYGTGGGLGAEGGERALTMALMTPPKLKFKGGRLNYFWRKLIPVSDHKEEGCFISVVCSAADALLLLAVVASPSLSFLWFQVRASHMFVQWTFWRAWCIGVVGLAISADGACLHQSRNFCVCSAQNKLAFSGPSRCWTRVGHMYLLQCVSHIYPPHLIFSVNLFGSA